MWRVVGVQMYYLTSSTQKHFILILQSSSWIKANMANILCVYEKPYLKPQSPLVVQSVHGGCMHQT
jgi:hypothetical protein